MILVTFLQQLAINYPVFWRITNLVFGRWLVKQSPPLPRRALPVELIAQIIDEAITPACHGALVPLDRSSFQPLVASKSDFRAIRGLSSTNHWIRDRVLAQWFSIMVVREVGDWDIATSLRICAHVKELRVFSKALSESAAKDAFMRFPNLHTAIIDAHNDFVLHSPSPANESQSIGHYRLVAPQLPSTLRRLWLTNAHGPDVRVIQNACAQCPQLEDLWIERCTLFSPRLIDTETVIQTTHTNDQDSQCHFWRNFPNDHDAYFASIGVADYAHSLAAELRPLKHLKRLHMGLYLTPTEALTAHRTHHANMRIHGSLWEPVCQSCSDEFGTETQEAEESATTVLAYEVPNLEQVSWSSFYSINKAGRSTFQIMRQSDGEVVCQRQIDKSTG
ncbi:unnamed protein product [Rhizoctonia solani]|uniref:Uncharacterized protein n=1 Tax=Rhizoctonia solani TaxID=456999 RepID=A0A8H3HX67_9AGAM|nr:unnamed protein product [Rhizoctonia solani]